MTAKTTRIIRMQPGENLYIVYPGTMPFRCWYSDQHRDLVVETVQPEDVPAEPEPLQVTATDIVEREREYFKNTTAPANPALEAVVDAAVNVLHENDIPFDLTGSGE